MALKGDIESISRGEIKTHICLLPLSLNLGQDKMAEKEDFLNCLNQTFEQMNRLDQTSMFTRSIQRVYKVCKEHLVAQNRLSKKKLVMPSSFMVYQGLDERQKVIYLDPKMTN